MTEFSFLGELFFNATLCHTDKSTHDFAEDMSDPCLPASLDNLNPIIAVSLPNLL